jgi:very-short-patch-repair endonuclease
VAHKSDGEEQLAAWLTKAGIPYTREWRFHPVRRWRFDFALGDNPSKSKLAIEVEGGAWTGGHKRGAAADTDCEKSNEAVMHGWRVLRFTTAMVTDGRAYKVIHNAWWPTTPCWP